MSDRAAENGRLEGRPEVGLAAIALSIAVHLCIGLVLAALWVPPELLSSKRREVVPTEVDVLEEPGSSEPIADVREEEDENLAQGPRGRNDSEDTSPTPTPAATATAAKPEPPPAATTVAVVPAPPPRSATARSSSTAAASGGAASSSSAAAPPGEPEGGGGEKRPQLPSLMARFTHDIADFGSGVPGWASAPVGDAGSIVVTLAVLDDGKLDKLHDPFEGAAATLPPLLVDSVTRTKGALVTKMGSRNVVVKFKVGALVSDGPPPQGETLALSFDSYDPKTKKGGSTFVLGTGRRVTFSVEVLETRALTEAP